MIYKYVKCYGNHDGNLHGNHYGNHININIIIYNHNI